MSPLVRRAFHAHLLQVDVPWAVRTMFVGRPRTVEADAGRAGGRGQVQRPRVGADRKAGPAGNRGQLQERDLRTKQGMALGGRDDLFRPGAFGVVSPDQQRRQIPAASQVGGYGGIAIDGPKLRRPAGPRCDQDKTVVQPQAMDHLRGRILIRRGGGHVKSHGGRPDAQRFEQFQPALDGMQAVGIDEIIVQPATDLAAPASAHADPPLRPREPGEDRRFGQPLGVDRRVEGQVFQLPSQSQNAGRANGANPAAARSAGRSPDGLRSVRPRVVRRPRPGRPGENALAGAGDRHGVDHVADGAEANQEDARGFFQDGHRAEL